MSDSYNLKQSIPILGLRQLVLLGSVLFISGCEYLMPKKEVKITAPPPKPAAILPSAAPIWASKADRRFAQTALRKMKYKVGPIDGIWGPRSAAAIKAFETDFGLKSADGKLSNLNLITLEKTSQLRRASFRNLKKKQPLSIQALLAKQAPLSEGPQLIILERSYNIRAKANPYSELVTTIQPGAGLYIINLQEGWYKVESTTRARGYIKAN